MSVAVPFQREFKAEKARLLFEGPYVMIGGGWYDVTPDGQRFLVLEPVEQEAVTHLNVVLNWFDELKTENGPTCNGSISVILDTRVRRRRVVREIRPAVFDWLTHP